MSVNITMYLNSPAAIRLIADALEAEQKAYPQQDGVASTFSGVAEKLAVVKSKKSAPAPVIEDHTEMEVDEEDEEVEEVEMPVKRGRGRPPKAVAAPPATSLPSNHPHAKPVEDVIPFAGDVNAAAKAYHGKFGLAPLKTLLEYRHRAKRAAEIAPAKQRAFLDDVQSAITDGVPFGVEDAIDADE